MHHGGIFNYTFRTFNNGKDKIKFDATLMRNVFMCDCDLIKSQIKLYYL